MFSPDPTRHLHSMRGALLQAVYEVRSTDVLFGRGTHSVRHPGNIHFRREVKMRKRDYVDTKKTREKDVIARQIISKMEAQGVRFLTKITSPTDRLLFGVPVNDDAWKFVDTATKLEKAKQALRDCRLPTQAEERDLLLRESLPSSSVRLHADVGSPQTLPDHETKASNSEGEIAGVGKAEATSLGNVVNPLQRVTSPAAAYASWAPAPAGNNLVAASSIASLDAQREAQSRQIRPVGATDNTDNYQFLVCLGQLLLKCGLTSDVVSVLLQMVSKRRHLKQPPYHFLQADIDFVTSTIKETQLASSVLDGMGVMQHLMSLAARAVAESGTTSNALPNHMVPNVFRNNNNAVFDSQRISQSPARLDPESVGQKRPATRSSEPARLPKKQTIKAAKSGESQSYR